jgi:hypothetical protein
MHGAPDEYPHDPRYSPRILRKGFDFTPVRE